MFLDNTTAFISQMTAILLQGLFWVVFAGLLFVLLYMLFLWYKHRNREEYALDFVTLLVRVPHENETKIDAAEQMFASLYSLKKDGFFSWLYPEDVISFEIVALKEEIGFYVSCPRSIRDLVEKQINGAYPLASIKEVDEVNIFSEKGRVAFAALQLDKADYFPLKT